MPKIAIEKIEMITGTGYPPPYRPVVLGRAKKRLGDAGGLSQFGVNLTVLAPGAGGQAVPAAVAVRSGEIETGQPLEAAVSLISLQRGFDAAMQAIQTYRRMDDRSTELGRVR